MKVWLAELKEGDIFYVYYKTYKALVKCEFIREYHDKHFAMGRAEYNILEIFDDKFKRIDVLKDSMFINQYVVTTYEEGVELAKESLNKELQALNDKNKLLEFEIKCNNTNINIIIEKLQQYG